MMHDTTCDDCGLSIYRDTDKRKRRKEVFRAWLADHSCRNCRNQRDRDAGDRALRQMIAESEATP